MRNVYSPASRLLTLLDLLQSRPSRTGLELAEALEVEPRSVRRYVTMLQDLGVPVVARRGRYGGYALRPGYKLPPLMLSDDEALAVTLGLVAARALPLGEIERPVAGALAKLERVLPAQTRLRAQALAETVALDLGVREAPAVGERGVGDDAEAPPVGVIGALSEAAHAGRRVWMRYRGAGSEVTERLFDPYGVVFLDGRWYAVGFCHLRGELRTFRLDRVQALEERAERFTPPAEFDALAYAVGAFVAIPDEWLIEVKLATTVEALRRVTPPSFATLEPIENGVLLRAYDRDLGHAARFLVGLGAPFQVVGPPELRGALLALADALKRAGGGDWAAIAASPEERGERGESGAAHV